MKKQYYNPITLEPIDENEAIRVAERYGSMLTKEQMTAKELIKRFPRLKGKFNH